MPDPHGKRSNRCSGNCGQTMSNEWVPSLPVRVFFGDIAVVQELKRRNGGSQSHLCPRSLAIRRHLSVRPIKTRLCAKRTTVLRPFSVGRRCKMQTGLIRKRTMTPSPTPGIMESTGGSYFYPRSIARNYLHNDASRTSAAIVRADSVFRSLKLRRRKVGCRKRRWIQWSSSRY